MKHARNTYGFLFPSEIVTFSAVAVPVTMGTLYFTAYSLTGMATFEVRGPTMASTLSWVMSFRAPFAPSVGSFLSSATMGLIWYFPVFS